MEQDFSMHANPLVAKLQKPASEFTKADIVSYIKENEMKKLISIFLSLVMALSVCSVAFVSNAHSALSRLSMTILLKKLPCKEPVNLYIFMSTKGLTAQAYLPLTAITAIIQMAKAKILLKLLIKVKIQLIMPLLFTTLGVKIMNIMPVRVTDVQCLTLAIPQ